MGDADTRRPQLDVGIEALVEEMVPVALCDACLAFAFQVALEDCTPPCLGSCKPPSASRARARNASGAREPSSS